MKTNWIEETLIRLPIPYCLCVTEKQFEKILDKLDICSTNGFIGKGHDGETRLWKNDNGAEIAIVSVPLTTKKRFVRDILTHEAVHVWQMCMAHINEDRPGDEIEAYGIEEITHNLISQWNKYNKKKRV